MIKIKWTEIKIDVDKETWRIAKARIDDAELRHDAQEDSTKTSMTLIMRWAESGIAMVTAALRERLTFSSTAESVTDAIDMTKTEWSFTLNDTTVISEEAIAMLIHKFVVEYILFRWCLLWLPNEASAYQKSYVQTLSDLTEVAFDLCEPTKDKRPTYSDEDSVVVTYETSTT